VAPSNREVKSQPFEEFHVAILYFSRDVAI